MITKRFYRPIICVLLAALTSMNAYACRCEQINDSMAERYAVAKYVFLAEIVSVTLTEARSLVAKFQVIEIFKGQPKDLTFIETQAGGMRGTCGAVLTAGDKFVVFADGAGVVSKCNGTQIISGNSSDAELLKSLRDLGAR